MTSPVSMPELNATFNDRLVSLHDGCSGLRSTINIDIRQPAPSPTEESQGGAAVLDFIASSETLDRYDEIILASGWRLDNYRRNPVFQNAHQYGDVIFTLGKALITEVRTRETPAQPATISYQPSTFLYQRVEFAVQANPMARIAYGLYKGKFLNAVSVGFIPLRWENGSAEAGYRRKYVEQELLEVSAVGIPANPEALQLGLKAGAIQKADLRELLDLLRALTDGRTGTFPVSNSVPSVGSCTELSAASEVPTAAPHPDPLPIGWGEGESRRSSTSARPFLSFNTFPAASHTHAGASGVRSNEARLLQLARALRDILRRT